MKKERIRIPKYNLTEELINSISHGIFAGISIALLVLMVVKAKGAMSEVSVTLFGSSMIILYTISCIYHALSPNIFGKKVLRVIDHCNVYILVFCTYLPISFIAIGGILGWIIFGVLLLVTTVGIITTSINIEKFQKIEVTCHLINGWGSLIFINVLLNSIGKEGVMFLILGGLFYTIGAILYGLGKKKKYMHSVFHFFCMLGTFFHFITVYFFVLK